MNRKIYFFADVFGMCGGVHAALKILEELVVSPERQVVVFHELVHNHAVTEYFNHRGVIFADNISDITVGATLVIGAHGVAPDVERELRQRAGVCKDATCPLVKKLHNIASGLSENDSLIIFGKAGHPEVEGVAGCSGTSHTFLISSPDDVDTLPELTKPVFISQTTVDHEEVALALKSLRKRFPNLRECSGICDASKKRQEAVLNLAKKVAAVIVIGSGHSSNARRLREIAERTGIPAFLIDNAGELTSGIMQYSPLGITSGASTPQSLMDDVVAVLEQNGFVPGCNSKKQ